MRSYGWSRDEFLAMTASDVRPPSAQPRAAPEIGDDDEHIAQVHRTKSGRLLRVEISSYPLDFDGRPARMVLVHDVTERVAAVQALAESEQKYRSVIEQLQDVFFRTDADGMWSFLNHAWTTLTGNPVAASLGTHHLSYVHPSDRSTLLDAFRALTDGTTDSMLVEMRMFHTGGGYRWVEASTHSVRNDAGQLAGTMGTLRDVTDRRAANEERQRLATNIRQLLDASGEGIFGVDARNIVTFVNRRGSEMLGFEPAELIGGDMHALTHHTRRDGTPYPKWECPIYLASTTGVPCEVDDEVLWRKDGTPLQVEYAASPVREHGHLSGAVVNFRDITARRRAEVELILARDAAEAANRAKSDFLARMSHELRTPLNSIIGFANVLLKNKRRDLHQDDRSYLNRIATNGLHLLGLINDILDLSKIEAGHMTLDFSEVSLETLVQETIAELEGQIGGKPVVLRTEIPGALRSIHTDLARLKQVLINLIGNALKFTDRGEVVVIVDAAADGHPRRLLVRDSGVGIPQHRLEAIFNAFEQAEAMTARRYGGTGLGLAISRSLCELMGHRLDVESVPDVGTTMIIRLGGTTQAARMHTPSSMAAIPSPDTAPQISAPMQPPVILVVDDDADARLLLGQLIEDAGCRVVQAATGIEALRMARELLPAMIFLELRLPKISGFDVFRILQADDTLRGTPVVIASLVGSESRNALAGAAAILDKPVTREQVEALVEKWLPGRVARQ